MIALYTEVFSDFLDRNEDSEEWQIIKNKFDTFPIFNLVFTNVSMYELFKEKYSIMEIGSETEEIFIYNVNNKVNELLVKYKPKIDLYLSNFNTLMDRKIALSESGENHTLLYPINNVNGKNATGVNFTGTKEQALLFFKSNADMLEQVMNIKDIYLDALQEFESCFMGIL